MFYGFLDLPWWGYVIYTLLATHITIAAVTIFLHRCQAHRALTLHPIVSHFFRLWLWLTTGMITKVWTAIHRKHHAKCETDEDPHSPQILGINTVLFKGAELFRKEAINQETLDRYGQGTPDDWLERNLYAKHSTWGIYATAIVNLILLGVPGIIVWAVQMSWIPFFAAGVINGLGHYVGYRNFECPDAATNIVPWGILIGGEELHNNHHAYPTSAKLSIKWWEFDLGWLYIKILSWLGLATIKRTPPKTQILPNKAAVDIETVKAIIINKFQVMAQYTKDVTLPVFQQVRQLNPDNERSKLTQLKPTLIRTDLLIKDHHRQALEQLLTKAHNQRLKIVYQFKNKLQAIWDQTTASQKELIESLQEWCRQAEATHIKCLQQFSRYLKSYALIV